MTPGTGLIGGSRRARLEEVEALARSTLKALGSVQLVRVPGSGQIARSYAEAREGASRWSFRGGASAYPRAVTLPGCGRRPQGQAAARAGGRREGAARHEPTVVEARELFERIGMPLPGSYADRDVAGLAREALPRRGSPPVRRNPQMLCVLCR
ncbi:hypothetical protein ACFQ0B_62780 [Nonomuraea thailandensis]